MAGDDDDDAYDDGWVMMMMIWKKEMVGPPKMDMPGAGVSQRSEAHQWVGWSGLKVKYNVLNTDAAIR